MRRFVPSLLERTHVRPHTTAFIKAGGVAAQPAAPAVAMRHIAAHQYNLQQGGGEKVQPPPLQSSLYLD